MKLTPLAPEDFHEIASWFNKASAGNEFIGYYKNPRQWFELSRNQTHRHAFVAITDKGVSGLADIEFDEDGDVSFAFGIKPNLRGKGLGRELVQLIVNYAKKANAKIVQGGVEESNTACRHLLESVGFSPSVKDGNVIQYIKTIG